MASLLGPIRNGRGLRPYAAFVLGFMLLVILEGAVVRATGSGAGCGDHWPLCNGEILPHHPRLATVIEFTHRSLTGLCTTLFAALIAWVFFAEPRRNPSRRAAVLTGLFLLTEAALGAILVLGHYTDRNTSNARVLVQSVHFTNTLLLVAMLTLTWRLLRHSRSSPALQPAAGTTPKSLTTLLWIAIAATVLTGATGSVAALADTLFPSPSLHAAWANDLSLTAPLMVRMRILHPAAAILSVFAAALLCLRLRSTATRALAWLLVLQLALGTADVFLLAPISLQLLHLLGADLYWIALILTAADIYALQSPAPEPTTLPQPKALHATT